VVLAFGEGMRRRNFVQAIGAVFAAWPIAVRAQQARLPVIGYLGVTNSEDEAARLNAFRRGLGEAGLIEGKNVLIEYRWAEGHYDRYAGLVADLVKRQVSLIAALGNSTAAITAKAATTSIPIVFAVGDDPITLGLVASLNQPGGNATGTDFFTAEVVTKRLGLLRDLLPSATRVAALLNPGDVARAEYTRRELASAAPGLGFQLEFFSATSSQEINDAFAKFSRDRPDALFVGPDPFFNRRRTQLAILAARYLIPATYATREYVLAGGLMSYGTNITDSWREAGAYAGKILKGTKPADLPVIRSTGFELVINVQTAKAFGIEVPASLLARADEVIE
jgi:putative tryptophan/tyrosine transport system substrate-binding protein